VRPRDEPAHSSPALQGDVPAPSGLAFNTEVEKNFLKTTYPASTEETVGCGVDLAG
jgi:hypothetical protein